MRLSRKPVLLLDRNYIADKIISCRKAFDLVIVREKAEVIYEYEENECEFSPSVIRLVNRSLATRRKRRPKFHKGSLLARDNHTCQYCGKYSKYGLTIDHIIPRSKGGDTSYENCVASCQPCNQKKGDMSLEDAGLVLKIVPYTPIFETLPFKRQAPEEWVQFLK
jgi:5-methylcytosine-specific restriction endonuclease McrA